MRKHLIARNFVKVTTMTYVFVMLAFYDKPLSRDLIKNVPWVSKTLRIDAKLNMLVRTIKQRYRVFKSYCV